MCLDASVIECICLIKRSDVELLCIMFEFVLGVVTVVSSSVGIWAAVNTTYRCLSPVPFQVGGATVTFSNMRLEAYMPGNDLSPRGSVLSCCFFNL